MGDEKKVNKALSPEEETIIGNLKSLLEQLGQTAAPAEEVAAAEDDKKDEEEKEVKMVLKDETTTPSDGPTASDDAEERIEDVQTDESKRSGDEVAKAITSLANIITGKKAVASKPVNPVMKAIGDLTMVVKGLAENNNSNSMAIEKICNSTGITKQLEIAEKAAKEKSENSVQKNETVEIIKGVVEALGLSKNNAVAKSQNVNPEIQKWENTGTVLKNENLANFNVLKAFTVHPSHKNYNDTPDEGGLN